MLICLFNIFNRIYAYCKRISLYLCYKKLSLILSKRVALARSFCFGITAMTVLIIAKYIGDASLAMLRYISLAIFRVSTLTFYYIHTKVIIIKPGHKFFVNEVIFWRSVFALNAIGFFSSDKVLSGFSDSVFIVQGAYCITIHKDMQ